MAEFSGYAMGIASRDLSNFDATAALAKKVLSRRNSSFVGSPLAARTNLWMCLGLDLWL